MDAVLAALLSFACGLVFVPGVRALARRTGMVCAPRDDRWHRTPTALLGGVGIYAAFLCGLLAFPHLAPFVWPTLIVSTILFAVGGIDDVVQIRPLTKLVAQLVAAGLYVWLGRVLPWTHVPLVDGALTIAWVVGIANAVNLLDNMDGLAAGIAAIASVFLGVTFWMNGQEHLLALPGLVAGACAAFLVFNFKPASIFMGDCGSLFLGTTLAGMGLLSSYGRSRSVASVLLAPVLIMAIPILDTTLVTVTRKLRGQPVSQGGRDHTSHRLVALGASEQRAVLILWGLAFASGAVSLFVRRLGVDGLLVVVPGFALVLVLFALYVNTVRVADAALRVTLLSDRRVAFDALGDGVLAIFAYVVAYGIRWDWDVPDGQWGILIRTLPAVAVVEVAGLWLGGVYRELWRHARVEDLGVIGRSTGLAAALATVAVICLEGTRGPSRGVIVLNGLLLLLVVTAARLSFRWMARVVAGEPPLRTDASPVIIYGTGARGTLLLHEMRRHPEMGWRPVAFVDAAASRGQRVHGLPVIGVDEVDAVVEREGVDAVLTSTSDVADEFQATVERLGLPLRTMRIAIE